MGTLGRHSQGKRRGRFVALLGKKTALGVLVTVGVLAATMALASADTFTETYTDSIAATSTDWATPPAPPDPLTFPQFDPVKGTLTSVTVTYDSALTGLMAAENLASASTPTLTWGAIVTLDTGDGILSSNLSQVETPNLGPFDLVIDFGGTSGVTFAGLLQTDNQVTVITAPAVLALYTGLGTITLDSTATGTSSATGGGNLVTQFLTNAGVDVEVKYTFEANPAIDIEKATNGQDADTPTGPYVAVGDPVTWTYVVTNPGDVQLSNIVVTDTDLGAIAGPLSGDTNTNGILETTETWIYEAVGVATAGQYANIGGVTGTPPVGDPVTDDDPSHYFGSDPSIDIEKATNGQDADTPTGPTIPVGDPVAWTYVVTNTGNVPLSAVVVTDDQGVAVSCPQSALAPLESMTCTASGVATLGQYANVGGVTGTPPVGDPVTDDDPSHYFGSAPSIHIEKATNGQDADTPTGPTIPVGDPVTWTYVVTNTGNVPLSNVVVTDDILGVIAGPDSGDANTNGILETTETWTYSTAGVATLGQYANIGDVVGSPLVGDPVTDDDPSHYFGSAPSIHIEKATNGQDADTPTGPAILVGAPVTWTYVVTNTGNVPLSNVVVNDDILGVIAGPDSGDANTNGILETTETWTYSTAGVATLGQYANIGDVTGTPAFGPPVTDDDPSHYIGVEEPGIQIEKFTNGDPGDDVNCADGPIVLVGAPVTWTYVVTNTGNVPLSNVVVTDDVLGVIAGPDSGDTNTNGILETSETWTYVVDGVAIAGPYSNVGDVLGVSPGQATVIDDDPSCYFGADPSIHIEKATNGEDADTPTGPTIPVGDPVTWTYVVTNTGNVPLSGVVVTDDILGVIAGPDSGDTNTNGILETTETWTYSAAGVAAAGQYANIGTSTGVPPVGPPVSDDDPSHYYGLVAADGCTPGYWKQTQHFWAWTTYTQGDSFEAIFGVSYEKTLLQALKAGGGDEKALGRHATAALLNASNPDVSYAYSEAQIIALVQDAWATGEYEQAKNLLAYQNELGCPIGGDPNK
ncbi:MAG: choice-of-anchor E domain-containing protein [Acidimicrobiia bacterium]|nr:choice-of-anchor E domain-containing protein [Acidimicrobiia bacterium]